ncbi:MAG TPA: phospholipid carrier-dependent glycosyltransferase [Leptolyngbyaceae cyanobacterium M33_DOE_097]|uniref:Phospholipid carrier-dependent glycosyltransferase n=1 Tax=Oscillatoriales cyanobacterium SpSt-418 TaxID=2282169 RepID=A0A7C3PRC0_9CYAN|nr:phospholipid carrier-dependent glycosyltransferase [Leptolyngbyaceae cyanobacterium M33_DOE_097]
MAIQKKLSDLFTSLVSNQDDEPSHGVLPDWLTSTFASQWWKQAQDWLILGCLWLLVVLSDRLWLRLDRTIPAWDQADYLNLALYHWRHFQQFEPTNTWWTELWHLSSKYPPFVFFATVPILNLLGPGVDQAVWVNAGFSLVLLVSVYLLGRRLFYRQVGLLAAAICLLMPGLYRIRVDYLLDYGLAAMVALCFCCLTYWWSLGQNLPFFGQSTQSATSKYQWLYQWLWAIAMGLTAGLAVLTKQTAFLFIFVPFAWAFVWSVWKRRWGQVYQLAIATILAWAVLYPWLKYNWLLVFSAIPRATLKSATQEGDPALTSLLAWTYYLKISPDLVSWLPLIVAPLGLVFYWRQTVVGRQWTKINRLDRPTTREEKAEAYQASWRSLAWLLVFLVGSYLLSSLNPNKDPRYITTLLPQLAVVLAYGLLLIPYRWQTISWTTLGVTALVAILNLFPVLPANVRILPFQTPLTLQQAYRGKPLPHEQIMAEVIKTEPYLRSVIGVMTSTPEVNQHNINLFGLLSDFQLRGRQVGSRSKQVAQEAQLLSWFLVQLDQQGVPRSASPTGIPPKQQLLSILEKSGDFQEQKRWQLPDGNTLKLFHRKLAPLEIQPLSAKSIANRADTCCVPTGGSSTVASATTAIPLQLRQVLIPERVPPGQPVPVTYRWQGNWPDLANSLMLISWVPVPNSTGETTTTAAPPPTKPSPTRSRWFHDHAIALGRLYTDPGTQEAPLYHVVERLSMLPPADLAPGTYQLLVVRRDRQTGKTTPMPVPPTQITIDPAAPPQKPLFPVDPVSQFRLQAARLPEGIEVYDKIARQIEILNTFDPGQDFHAQALESMEYRLKQEPKNREFAYGLALNHVLNRRVEPAIAALERVTQLDPKNPNAFGYLAFVNLYGFRPRAAQPAIDTALKLNPNLPELHLLNGVSALLQGNVVKTWQSIQTYQAKEKAQAPKK